MCSILFCFVLDFVEMKELDSSLEQEHELALLLEIQANVSHNSFPDASPLKYFHNNTQPSSYNLISSSQLHDEDLYSQLQHCPPIKDQ